MTFGQYIQFRLMEAGIKTLFGIGFFVLLFIGGLVHAWVQSRKVSKKP